MVASRVVKSHSLFDILYGFDFSRNEKPPKQLRNLALVCG